MYRYISSPLLYGSESWTIKTKMKAGSNGDMVIAENVENMMDAVGVNRKGVWKS